MLPVLATSTLPPAPPPAPEPPMAMFRKTLVSLVLIALPDGARFVLPLSPMAGLYDYTLLKIDDAPQDTGLADLLCVSFARGTMITLASGQQRAIEALRVGDKVLSRDHGGQEIRWIGSTTLRAVGAFAPVVITAGTLGNSGDL